VLRQHVSLERSHEEKGGGWWVGNAESTGLRSALKVVDDNTQTATWRAVVVAGVEWQHHRCPVGIRVHGHDEASADHPLHERDEPLGQPAQDDARIFAGVRRSEIEDAPGRLHDVICLHCGAEECLLRFDVAEDGGGGDAQVGGDVGESGGREALGGEDAPGVFEELVAVDGRRAAHL